VKDGEDKLPIEAYFRIVRKQQDTKLRIGYREERKTDNYKWKRTRTWDWEDKGDAVIKAILGHKGWAYFAFVLKITETPVAEKKEDSMYEEVHEKKEQKEDEDDKYRKFAKPDSKAKAELKVLFCITEKRLALHELDMTKPNEVYEIAEENPAANMDAATFGSMALTSTDGNMLGSP